MISPDNFEPDAPILLFGDIPPNAACVARHVRRLDCEGRSGRSRELPLPQREYCSLSGVLAGALAIAEFSVSFAEISVEATRRTVGLSLWRPDLDIDDPAAFGIPGSISSA